MKSFDLSYTLLEPELRDIEVLSQVQETAGSVGGENFLMGNMVDQGIEFANFSSPRKKLVLRRPLAVVVMLKLSSHGKTIDRKHQERVESFLLSVHQLPGRTEQNESLAGSPRHKNHTFEQLQSCSFRKRLHRTVADSHEEHVVSIT
jgi:hypothetical protein